MKAILILLVLVALATCGGQNKLEDEGKDAADFCGYLWQMVTDDFSLMANNDVKNSSNQEWQSASDRIFDFLAPNVEICLTNFVVPLGCVTNKSSVFPILFTQETSERNYVTFVNSNAGEARLTFAPGGRRTLTCSIKSDEEYRTRNDSLLPLRAQGELRKLRFNFKLTFYKHSSNQDWQYLRGDYILNTEIGIFSVPQKRNSFGEPKINLMEPWTAFNPLRMFLASKNQ